ncbi:D-arabinose 5-phosphate isomerase [Novimethylophilus kurashikiensis]|uniref:D-arabinose 5-phosphate isomerase n=1 Tax=Novimethylophilus kurashikiensis TaxID=1825523 RepID=A0A2R5F711_9PROT|nr:hypothetical protein [Novimethylophilus kurashikiensis]GBG14020.1 D-arabinose 5-phosphate isomerase [Novimethylophilus kurashikiensis]
MSAIPRVGKDSKGQTATGGNATPGFTLPGLNGFSATPPVALSAGDNASSTTRSGISGGSISITNEAKQQTTTGKDAATTVATLNRDVATGKDTTDALGKIFTDQTKQNINAGFEIVGAFSQQASTFLDNRAKESTAAQQALDAENAKPADQRNQDVINQATQVLQDNQIWAMGGTGRIALTTVTAAFSGNLTGSGTELVQSATIRTLQALGAQEIKQLADSLGGEGSAAHTALHAVLACAGAEATGSDCGTAALAASGGVIINTLLDQIDGKGSTNLTPAEKEARATLINTLITSTTAALGGDAATASIAARIETENNGLKELFFPPDLPKMPFYGYVKNQDKSFTLVEKFASIDREKSRIILIAPGDRVLSEDRALYAAGAGGDEVNGYTVIFAHATDKTIQGVRMTEPAMFNQFVDMIKNSGAWEPGKPIMIDACNAGRLDSGIASALAKALNTVVVAPTTQTWQFPIWSTSGMTGAFEPTEPNGDYPNIQAPGKWKTFGPNGSVISTSKYPPNAPFQK